MSAKPIDRIEDLSPAWMTQALGTTTDIDDLNFRPIGTGQVADSFRIELFGPHDAPGSVVIKMQAADDLARIGGAKGSYHSEVGFYTDLAPTVSIRTPECFYATGPDDDGRFVLVLEDMAPAEQGDQLLGCSLEQALVAVINLAGLHGPRWCDPSLMEIPWLRCVSHAEAEYFGQHVIKNTKSFIQHYAERLTDSEVEVLQSFAPRCSSWLMERRERFSLVHGDYRLDNLLFGDLDGDVSITAVDWQTVEVGNPGRDLAYFLGNSLHPSERRAHEQELVRAYHQALLSHGVRDYTIEDCMDDYRFGHFQGLFITILAAVSLAHTDRGDDMFMAMCSRACEAIRDLDSVALL